VPLPPEYLFLVQEQEPPFLCSLVGLEPTNVELGDRRTARALEAWKSCYRSGTWPAYPNRVAYPELPAWEFTRDAEQDAAAGYAYDPDKLFADLRRDPFAKKPQESDLIFPN